MFLSNVKIEILTWKRGKQMFLKKKTKEPETPKVIHLKRFQPFFTTIDGIQHEGPDFYNWINADGLRRAAP